MSEQHLGADPFHGIALIPHDEFSALTLTQDPGNPRIARITFNRPNKLNASFPALNEMVMPITAFSSA
jgi:1,4-dihydroxy-2-naphthoyl-CoA synthase